MALSDKDRKLLWGRAGNVCSYNRNGERCDAKLSEKSETEGDDFVVGVECHIVGDKPASARYREDRGDKETHENYILLCPTHHTHIDQDRNTYSVETLKAMKEFHESYIESLNAKPTQLIEIKDSHFVMNAKNADIVVGMEVNRPARLTNVKSELNVENVTNAVGFTTNQGLSSIAMICSCGQSSPHVYTGQAPSILTCPYCGKEHRRG